jgi:hypothetical protein
MNWTGLDTKKQGPVSKQHVNDRRDRAVGFKDDVLTSESFGVD